MNKKEELEKKILEKRILVDQLSKFEKTMHFLDDCEEVEMYQLMNRAEKELKELENLYQEKYGNKKKEQKVVDDLIKG